MFNDTAFHAYLGVGALLLLVICLIDLKFARRVNHNLYGFFLMSGKLRLGGFIGAILAANLSLGNFLIFVASWGFTFGAAGIFWFIVNLLLNSICYIVFVPAFRNYIQNHENSGTIHEFLSTTFAPEPNQQSVAKKIRLVASATTIIGLLFAIVFEIHLAAALIGPLLHINIALLFSVLTVFICIYSAAGGFHTLIFTDILQSVVMFIGAVAIVPIVSHITSYTKIVAALPPLSAHSFNIGWVNIVSICVIGSGWFLVAMDQWQRTCATRDANRTKWGMAYYFVAISFFAILFGYLGMFDKASIVPAIGTTTNNQFTGGANPLVDFFLIGHIFPSVSPLLLALVAIALLAAAMSTANTFLIVSSHSFVSDLLMTIAKKNTFHSLSANQAKGFLTVARSSIVGMGFFVSIAWLLFNFFGLLNDPLSFFFIAYSIQFALLAPMVYSRFSNRITISPKAIFASICLSVLTALVGGIGFWIWSQHSQDKFLGIAPSDWLTLTPVITWLVGMVVSLFGIKKRNPMP